MGVKEGSLSSPWLYGVCLYLMAHCLGFQRQKLLLQMHKEISF